MELKRTEIILSWEEQQEHCIAKAYREEKGGTKVRDAAYDIPLFDKASEMLMTKLNEWWKEQTYPSVISLHPHISLNANSVMEVYYVQ